MNKFNNIFGQILQIFSKKEFYEAVIKQMSGVGEGQKEVSLQEQTLQP